MNWRNLRRNLALERRFESWGPRTDVPRLVRAADVFAMSSKSEGMPVSLLEAMALAKPVVCTRVGGIPGVITDGANGLLVEPGNDSEMAERLRTIAQDESLRLRLGHAAQEHVRRQYDIRVMVEKVESEYRRLLKMRNRVAVKR